MYFVAMLKKELEKRVGVARALQMLTQWPKDISVIDKVSSYKEAVHYIHNSEDFNCLK